jgi:hypothetical protein
LAKRIKRAEILIDKAALRRVVHFSDGSFESADIAWNQVMRIAAFKRDMFSVDLICLAFETNSSALEVDEEMEGWEKLLESLPNYFEKILLREEWWNEVAHPAFAINLTQIYPINQ